MLVIFWASSTKSHISFFSSEEGLLKIDVFDKVYDVDIIKVKTEWTRQRFALRWQKVAHIY